MPYRWLVVGAGFTGATVARRLAEEAGARVLVVDRRPHVAGNSFDERDAHGVVVHRYGPHAFHTNSARIWHFLSRFTAWHPYEHRVQAEVEGRLVPVPFNLTSLEACFGSDAPRLEQALLAAYPEQLHVPILKMLEHPDGAVRCVAEYAFAHVFDGYTRKQWALAPHELDPSVTARVPVRLSRDDRYFLDTYQATPKEGFAALFDRMLDHPNIELRLGCDLADLGTSDTWDRMLYTGPLDAYFGYGEGALPYRSLRFEPRFQPGPPVQPVAQVNYPNAHAYTRITEFVHMTGQTDAPGTTCVAEYPLAHVAGQTEPYYPIPREENRALFDRYAALARKEAPRVLFAGRLADYQYYNMDQAVGRALALFDKEIAGTE